MHILVKTIVNKETLGLAVLRNNHQNLNLQQSSRIACVSLQPHCLAQSVFAHFELKQFLTYLIVIVSEINDFANSVVGEG